ncbi:MAG: helix-turn-helix domain-containing protein [Clostridia bacterium]|nr:helix-turn-helix domain-containing protein [Clostridia bacterium]
MDRNERIKILRKNLKMSQEELGKILGISKSGVSDIESHRRNVTEQHIIMITQSPALSPAVNPEWLRDGVEPMFIEPDTFSLDEFIRARGATELETRIIKAYFELPADQREYLLNHFKERLSSNPVKDAEEEYIKSRSKSAQSSGSSVLSSTDGEKKEA